MKRKHVRFIGYCLAIGLIAVLTMGTAACSSTPTSTPPAPTLSSIAVTPASPANLEVGSTLQFTAAGTYSDGSTVPMTSQVTWDSSDTTIATISSAGLATAIAGGNTNITASLSGVSSPPSILTIEVPAPAASATPTESAAPVPTESSIPTESGTPVKSPAVAPTTTVPTLSSTPTPTSGS